MSRVACEGTIFLFVPITGDLQKKDWRSLSYYLQEHFWEGIISS